jgi:methylmalonyl-CoA mutase N-terminal domain/subunit
MVEAVKRNFPQREIADASYELQAEIDSGRRLVVGVNSYTEGAADDTPILHIDAALERKQIGRVQAVRSRRNTDAVERCLAEVRSTARSERNLMPALLAAARARVTEGEMVQALQAVWGAYTETPVF